MTPELSPLLHSPVKSLKVDKLHSVISYTTEFHFTYSRFLVTVTCSFSRPLQVVLTLQTMHREKSRWLPGLGWPVKMNILRDLVKSTLSKDFLQPHSGSFLIEGKFNNYLHVTYKKTTCSLFPERL